MLHIAFGFLFAICHRRAPHLMSVGNFSPPAGDLGGVNIIAA